MKRLVSQEQFERECTSWENIYHCKRELYIEGRNPTIEELKSHYLKYNKVIQTFMVLPPETSQKKI